ncbi:MAG: c-type cytochrome [Myxococcaceae bacterium]
MGKPVERQNHSLSFFLLAMLIALCTGWAFYEEFLGRRPWKEFQSKISQFETEKLQQDVRYFERKLEAGDFKVVPDAKKPNDVLSVAEAEKRLAELEQEMVAKRPEIEKLKKELVELKIQATDADLKVKYLKSDDDGLFYEFQHAEHEESMERASAKRLEAEGDKSGAASAISRAESHGKHRVEVEKQREEKHKEVEAAKRTSEEAQAKYQEGLKRQDALIGEHTRIKAAIAAAKDPILTAKASAEKAAKKGTELTQFWLTAYDNSVDRCQNCHAAVDKCGFSRPYEVLAALNAPNADPKVVSDAYCANPDTIDAYKRTADEICGLTFDEEASEHGKAADKGRCFDGADRDRVLTFFDSYCGRESKPSQFMRNPSHHVACVNADTYKTLASYVEEPEPAGYCNIQIAGQGDTCLEGAQRDLALAYFSKKCAQTSATVKGLKDHVKACAGGEDGKKLSAARPVAYDFPVWAQTHPYRSELIGKHASDRFGCTTCHEGQGAQTKGVAGNAFTHGYDDHYWERPMLDLVAYKEHRPAQIGPSPWGAPDNNSTGVPGRWVAKQTQFNQASCAKCHTEEIHLKFADDYTKGRRLIAEIGCHGCHPIEPFREFPKIGPTLTDLKKKTTPAFLATWIAYPKSFRPRTKMPNFWPEALGPDLKPREGSHELELRTKEVQQIAAYLWKNSDEGRLPSAPPGNVERGKLLVQQVGCRGCHTFTAAEKLCTPEQVEAGKTRGTAKEPGECEAPRSLSGSDARDFAPNLANIGHKAKPAWLFAWVKNPTSMWAGTRMPNLRLSDDEAADITAYLMTLKEGPEPNGPALFANENSPEFEAAAAEGSKLITKYGCTGCHDVKHHELDAKIGAPLDDFGRKTVDLLDFGNAVPNPRHHSWFNWTDLKLRAPRIYKYERVDTRMPQFDLNDDEVRSLLVFLKSRISGEVPLAYRPMADERRLAVAKGDQTIEYFNCRGCHVVDGRGGEIRDIFAEDDIYKAPPLLQQEGWRVQPDWLFAFLQNPANKLRPWLDVRMPTFPLNDERATTLIKGFAASSNVPYPFVSVRVKQMGGAELAEAQALFTELKCLSCHTTGELRAGQDPSSAAPNLLVAKHRLRPDWVASWIKNPQSLQEGTRMPSFFTPDDMGTVMYPKYFGGSQERQIEALRNYVMTLNDGPTAAAAKPRASRR